MQLSAVLVQLASLAVRPPEVAPPAGTPTPTPSPAASGDQGPATTDGGSATATVAAPVAAPATAAATPTSAPAPATASASPSTGRIPSGVHIGDILDLTCRAGFGFAIALLSLTAIPFVGLSVPFGLAIALLGGQMILGYRKPWFPRRIRDHVVTLKTMDWLGTTLARWARRMERFVKPRLLVLTRPPLFIVIGLAVTLQALGLALPLPIPGSNWIFIAPLLIYAVGLLEEDGLLILFGHLLTVIQIALCIIFWALIRETLTEIFQWFAQLVS